MGFLLDLWRRAHLEGMKLTIILTKKNYMNMSAIKQFTRTLYRLDRVWYDLETKKIIGDLSFSFGESRASVCFNGEELEENLLAYIYEEELGDLYEENDTNAIPIYLIQKGEGVLYITEEEYKESTDILEEIDYYDTSETEWQTIKRLAVCSKDYATEVGLAATAEKWEFNIDKYLLPKP